MEESRDRGLNVYVELGSIFNGGIHSAIETESLAKKALQ